MLIRGADANEKTLLIIDDEDSNFFALAAVLKSRGYRCVSANNISEGFLVLEKTSKISAILMDIMMPGIDGYEATSSIKLRKEYEHIPIIAVTALTSLEDRDRALKAGADAFVTKPVDIDQLIKVLDELINSKEALPES